jgi:hypothetical protein
MPTSPVRYHRVTEHCVLIYIRHIKEHINNTLYKYLETEVI